MTYERSCFCCEYLPKRGIIRDRKGYLSFKEDWYKNTLYCKSCRSIPFGGEGCRWSVAPIPLEELIYEP